MDRRKFLQALGGVAALPALKPLAAAGADAVPLTAGLPAGAYGIAQMASLAGKRPLIEWTARPPNYESPLTAFANPITPNDLFFVRYHLAGIPPQIDVQQFRIAVSGEAVATPQQLLSIDGGRSRCSRIDDLRGRLLELDSEVSA